MRHCKITSHISKQLKGPNFLQKGYIYRTWKVSIHLHKQNIFNPKFYLEACILQQNKYCHKTANNENNTILLASQPSFFFGIQK